MFLGGWLEFSKGRVSGVAFRSHVPLLTFRFGLSLSHSVRSDRLRVSRNLRHVVICQKANRSAWSHQSQTRTPVTSLLFAGRRGT